MNAPAELKTSADPAIAIVLRFLGKLKTLMVMLESERRGCSVLDTKLKLSATFRYVPKSVYGENDTIQGSFFQ
jgi:hypothetical protein